jgi:hypothetical protein
MTGLKLIAIGVVLSLTSVLQAQVSLSINFGTPPQWGPDGYPGVRYYYIPDVEAYYDIHSSQFIYFAGGKWIYRSNLPRQYRSYDLYNGYKVVMTDYQGNSPYTHFNEYKTKYAKGHMGQGQKTIGMKPGNGNNKIKIHSKSISTKNGVEGNNKNSKKGHNSGGKKGK